MRSTTSQRETEKSNYRQDHVSRISSFLGSLSQDPLNTELRSEIMSLSDEENSLDTTNQEDSIKSQQRLGITPFSVQKPEDLSFSEDAMSPMMQRLAKAEALRVSRGDHSLPADEQEFDRRRAQSDGEHYHNQSALRNLRGHNAMFDRRRPELSDLRTTDAIIDNSRSEVNVGSFQSPSDEEQEPEPHRSRIPQFRTPKSNNKYDGGTSPNPRFNKLRNLFEERPNEAIFPPDQHWQYGVAK
jgi:hypothetical protein